MAFRKVRRTYPFEIVAMVVMPDRLHVSWRLPENDANFSLRWLLIKAAFSKTLSKTEHISASQKTKRERGIWQRRFWEHLRRDDNDLENHVAHIHFNSVKHGYVSKAVDWPYSSIHKTMMRGDVDSCWAGET